MTLRGHTEGSVDSCLVNAEREVFSMCYPVHSEDFSNKEMQLYCSRFNLNCLFGSTFVKQTVFFDISNISFRKKKKFLVNDPLGGFTSIILFAFQICSVVILYELLRS